MKRYNLTTIIASAALACAAFTASAQPVTNSPALIISAPYVAVPAPVSTFAMPVSQLSYHPGVDVQGRNFSEAQGDIAIRGGIFRQTGFRVGALPFFDGQTGHYAAELPIPPNMLQRATVLTGAQNALSGFNSAVGTVQYQWAPITPGGEITIAGGSDNLNRQSVYTAFVQAIGGDAAESSEANNALGIFSALSDATQIGIDAEYARSEGDGSVSFGDHTFERFAGRVQLLGAQTQTDLFAGYQSKFFGWPNLYTPFGVNETEALQTTVVALQHAINYSAGDSYLAVSAGYRRHKDDYEFNRTNPGQFNAYQHETITYTLGFENTHALEGEWLKGTWAIESAGSLLADDIDSTSLTFSPFESRTYAKLAIVPAYTRVLENGNTLEIRAGASIDTSNRDSTEGAPIAEIAYTQAVGSEGATLRTHLSYAETTQVPSHTALGSNPSSGLFRGDANLKRERSKQTELGFIYTRAQWAASAKLFHRSEDDLVDWTFDSTSPNARSANAVNRDVLGLEALVAYTLPSGKGEVSVGYTYLEQDLDYGNAAPSVDASFYAGNLPRHRVTTAARYNLTQLLTLRSDIEYRMQQRNSLRAGDRQGVLGHVAVSYAVPAVPGLSVTVGVDNVFNIGYQEIPGVPAARRTAVIGATYSW